MKELNTLDLSYASTTTLPTPAAPLTILPDASNSSSSPTQTKALPPGAVPAAEGTRAVMRDMRTVFDAMDQGGSGVVDRRKLAMECHKNAQLNALFSEGGRKRDVSSLCADVFPKEGNISWPEFVTVLGENLQ